MKRVKFKDFTPRQQQAWLMRYWYGWRIVRIAAELAIRHPAVVKLLMRTEIRAGLVRTGRVRIIRTAPRLVRVQSLSTAKNY